MPQVLNLKVSGLNTNPSEFGAREGSLKVAKNVNIDSPHTATSRRGFTKYGDPLSATGSGTYKSFYNYEDTILTHYGSSLYKDDGSGTWSVVSNFFDPSDSEVGIRSIKNNGSIFFTTDNGIYKLDDINNTPALAGIPRAIGFDTSLDGSSGFFTANTQVAYRVVWGKTDANGVVSLGFPSERGEIANVNAEETGAYTETRNVSLTIYIPSEITTDYFFQVYRSGFSADENTVANDELQLVYENNPTSAEITAGEITFIDNTPDSLRGATIYTAPTQEGIGQANELPPLSVDCTTYKGYGLYANTKTKHRKYITLLAVGGSSGLNIADEITIAGVAYTAAAAQDADAGEFEVVTSGTAAENIRDTAKSLVQVINRYTTNTETYAYYVSGYDELPGKILIERRDLSDTSFDITWDRASTGGNDGTMWKPPLGTTPITSDNEEKGNRIYVSKYSEFDAVPILQYFDAGSGNSAIRRIISLRDSVIL
jgi:hypothetical protein